MNWIVHELNLSDNSKVYDVRAYDDTKKYKVTLSATDEDAAMKIAELLNDRTVSVSVDGA